MAGKNRTFRTDLLTHPKTAGLHPLDRDILFFQVVAANIAGVLERSVAKVARECGGGTTQKAVKASLRRLEKGGHIRWWPDLELVWAVEAADNQARTPAAWRGVRNVVDVLPMEVQDAFAKRYPPGEEPEPGPKKGTAAGPKPGPEGGPKPGPYDEDLGISVRGNRSLGEGGAPPKTKAEIESELRGAVQHIRERIRWGEVEMPRPPGRRDALGFPSLTESRLIERLREGATPDEVVATFAKLSRRITAGELQPDMWGTVAVTGFYAALRDDLPIPGKSKLGVVPCTGPVVETVEEARRYFAEHGRLPDGWGWHDDGRGNHTPVAVKGGAA